MLHFHCSQQVTQSHSFDCSHTSSEIEEHHGLKTAGTFNFSTTNHCTHPYPSICATVAFEREVK
jgi:hypothetical protein